jgi:hypothetical protein
MVLEKKIFENLAFLRFFGSFLENIAIPESRKQNKEADPKHIPANISFPGVIVSEKKKLFSCRYSSL